MQQTIITKPSFPQIKSSVHDQAVILTRINPDDPGRFFICAQDIIDGVAGDKSTLQTYEEFCNYIAQPNIIPSGNIEELNQAKELIKAKNQNSMKFSTKIEEEKYGIKRLLNDKLQQLYKNKCTELVDKLQEELEEQNKLFINNYEKLGKEIEIDREKEAGLLTYGAIVKKIKEIKEPAEVEEYLKNVYKNKIVWKSASDSIQTIGKRTEAFYSGLIDKQLAHMPTLSNVDKLIETWVGGLDKLITKVKSDSHMFKNMICTCELQVPLQINNLKEFTLITNEMLKRDTELIIQLKGQALTELSMVDFNAHLNKLSNLAHFTLDITGGQFPINCIKEFIKPFQYLTQLKTVQIKAYGVKLGDQGVQELSQLIQYITKIEGFALQLGFNGITNTGLTVLGQRLKEFINLKWLSLQLESNAIKSQGLASFCESLETIVHKMTCLSLGFGGSQFKANKLEATGAIAIMKALKKATMLKYLKLDFGNNMIDNSFLREFCFALVELQSLSDMTLKLYNNQIDVKGAKKLAKWLNNNKIYSLKLNLSGNEIQFEGANYLIASIKTMDLLANLTLNLRNTGIKKGFASSVKAELETKTGRSFEKFQFLA